MSNYYAQTLQMSFANTPVLIKKKNNNQSTEILNIQPD